MKKKRKKEKKEAFKSVIHKYRSKCLKIWQGPEDMNINNSERKLVGFFKNSKASVTQVINTLLKNEIH